MNTLSLTHTNTQEGSVEREAEASFRRRLTGANANVKN
jgi:hypothetical protein